LAATAWLQRTEDRVVDLGPSGPYRVRSTAGPVTISNGDDPALHYRASWLVRGPSLTGDGADDVFPNDVVLRCNTRFPCRAGANVDVPNAEELVVEAVGNDVFVDHFDGTLSVVAAGAGDVVLGPVAGVVTVSTEDGAIIGSGLTAKEVELDTRSGEVDVWFGARPDTVTIRSGSEPVTLRLPDGDYAVSVKSGSSIIVTVGQVATADSVILVQARGPVRIEPTK
jgi:hypothetical protein